MAQLVSGELQYLILYKAFESRQTGSKGPQRLRKPHFMPSIEGGRGRDTRYGRYALAAVDSA
jgi:hypothetical protein